MQRIPQALPYAEVQWDSHGSPISTTFEEAYFSTRDPIRERTEVFLEGNNLPHAWSEAGVYTVAELGFGFGLSFLLTWKLWTETAPKNGTLHFISFEQSPAAKRDLQKAHARWPELSHLSQLLLNSYPRPIKGNHRIILSPSVVLTLVFGDATETLPLQTFSANAWFLDGFSPGKNPALWTKTIVHEISRLSVPDATTSSFSVARVVRDSLAEAGWHVERMPGVPPKRERLIGKLSGKGFTQESNSSHPSCPQSGRGTAQGTALIIGGGISGSALADSLSRRGMDCLIIERNSELALGASGNPGGIFMPHVSLDPDPISRFAIHGYLHAVRACERFEASNASFHYHRCGVLRFASSNRLSTLIDQLDATGLPQSGFVHKLSREEASEQAGVDCHLPAMFFPDGGWVNPRDFTALPLQNNSLVQVLYQKEVKRLLRESNSWILQDERGEQIAQGDYVFLCNSVSSIQLEQSNWLPLEAVRGQLISQSENPSSERLRCVLCYDGYILPAYQGLHVIGATYDHGDTRTEVDSEQSFNLLQRVHDSIPGLNFSASDIVSARVSFRAMSRDRLPLIGKLPILDSYKDQTGYREHFAPEYYPNLFVSLGQGSRGLITAHLSAEIICAELFDEPCVIESDLFEHLQVERYLTRLLKRGISVTKETASSFRVLYPPPRTQS